ncbi:ankyrin repeat domain-containing protein [Pleomorphomonas sp. PLEO]|uniref:nSTAND1 domain-containing NTPase n=1 Tax=Pleomorphomonas sp. PLEO TaxID=3239306 RepID=UPI00351DE01F
MNGRLPTSPYPGLRSYSSSESNIFFGREEMVQDVVRLLAENSLVTIHGDSGSGKSSLVCAGVLPLLKLDQSRAQGCWRTCITQPGNSPLHNLAAGLAEVKGDASDENVRAFRRAFRKRTGIIEHLIELLDCKEDNCLCIIIDQFEELFEYSRFNETADANIIISILNELATKKPNGLYVIITMRTEYLGKCAQYEGFAEIVNRTQYLVPYMKAQALLRAISVPAALYGGSIDDKLARLLANEASNGQDRLSLLQHGLSRLWALKCQTDEAPNLTVEDYVSAGSLSTLISSHANEILYKATGGDSAKTLIVERIFRALISRNADGLAIRRPQTYREIQENVDADDVILQPLLACFRGPEACLLRPYGDQPLAPETLVDISHEALIRNWNKIVASHIGWFDRENEDALIWHSLRVATENYKIDSRMLLSVAVSADRASWMSEHSPGWARRYGGDWDAAAQLVEASRYAEAALWAARGRSPSDVHLPVGVGVDGDILEEEFDPTWPDIMVDYTRERMILWHRRQLIVSVKGGTLAAAYASVKKLRELGFEQLLDTLDRGSDSAQLHRAFWAAITGDDRSDKAFYSSDVSVKESVFEGEEGPRLLKRTTSLGMTPLAWAFFAGRNDLAQKMIERFKADPNVLDTLGASIIHYCAYSGNIDGIKYLVKKCNVDPLHVSLDGGPPIIWAIQQKHHKVISYLLSKGQRIDFLAEGSWNALTESVRADDILYTKKLINKYKFNTDHKTKDNQSLIHVACFGEQANTSLVTQYLCTLPTTNILARTQNGSTPLHIASISRGKISAIPVLLEAAKVKGIALSEILNARDEFGDTPLHNAATEGNIQALEALLEAGADADAVNNTGDPAVVKVSYVLATMGNSARRACLHALIRHGARLDLYDSWSVLHYAADDGDLETLITIHSSNHNINWNVLETGSGWTPLMRAIGKGRIDCIAFLLREEVGANPFLKSSVSSLDAFRLAIMQLQSAGDEKKITRARNAVNLLRSYAERRKESDEAKEALRVINSEVFFANPHRFGRAPDISPSLPELVMAAREGNIPSLQAILASRSTFTPDLGQAIREAALKGKLEALHLLLPLADGIISHEDLSRYAEEASQVGQHGTTKALIGAGASEPDHWNFQKVSIGATFLQFSPFVLREADPVKQRLCQIDELIGEPSGWIIKQAPLTFLRGCKLLAIEHKDLPGANEQFVIVERNNNVTFLDWTNEPIYMLCERIFDISKGDAVRDYVRFFFHFVRGKLGRFQIVDSVDDILWSETARKRRKQSVEKMITPLTVTMEDMHGVTLSASVVFGNALFKTNIYVTKRSIKFKINDSMNRNQVRGVIDLMDEKLLARNLDVRVPTSPTVFG